MADFSVMPKMLPALPQAFGNLKDVFHSAFQSVLGHDNALALPSARNALVIMVDGLGYYQLKASGGHASFLNRSLTKKSKLLSGFPSTTAASLVSIATGVSPSEHGFIGYKVFDRRSQVSVNLLTGLDSTSVANYLKAPRIFESAFEAGVQVSVITKPEYLGSGFSLATFGNAKTSGYREIDERFAAALDELNSGSKKLIYLYVPELDQAAHRFGVDSPQWLEVLELIDREVKKIDVAVKRDCGILLTADHGVIDVKPEHHVYLDEFADLERSLVDVGGDPRSTFLYLRNDTDVEVVRDALNQWLGEAGAAFSIEELVSAGYYEAEVFELEYVLPDLVLLAGNSRAVYHRDFAKPASLKMVGQHGGVTLEETTVPQIRLAAYSSSLLVP